MCQYCHVVVQSDCVQLPLPSNPKKIRYFCSGSCKDRFISKYQVGSPHTLNRCLKIANSNKKPMSDDRKRKIGIANSFKFTDEQLDILNTLLNKPYNSTRKISKILNVWLGHVNRYIKQWVLKSDTNADIQSRRIVITKSLLWDDDNLLKYIDDNCHLLNICDIEQLTSPLGISKIDNGFLNRFFGRSAKQYIYKFHAGQTAPERIFEQFLIDNHVKFEYNKMVSVQTDKGILYYSVDFVLSNNIFVEIQGDFWHGNPSIYTADKLIGVQRSNMNRDSRKKTQIMKFYKPLNYLQIWEFDIKNDTKTFNDYKNYIKCTVQK